MAPRSSRSSVDVSVSSEWTADITAVQAGAPTRAVRSPSVSGYVDFDVLDSVHAPTTADARVPSR